MHNHGDAGDFSTVDIRMALQDLGALLPEALPVQQEWLGEEDLRGVEEFVKWFSGQRMKEIMDFAKGDGENDEIDYLHGESGRGLLAFQLALSPLAWLTYDDSTEKET